MSDLSITLEALERSRSQLSVSTYFSEDLLRRERELIFQHGPRYMAHEYFNEHLRAFYFAELKAGLFRWTSHDDRPHHHGVSRFVVFHFQT